jgi:hypothetical protein
MKVRERLEQLKDASVCAPSAAWKAAAKAQLLCQVGNSAGVAESARGDLSYMHRLRAFIDTVIPEPARAYVRPVAIACASFLVVVTSSLASVSASQNSVPGEILWKVKLAAEKTQVSMAKVVGDTEGVARINLDRASKRVEEIKKLADAVGEETQNAALIADVAIPELEATLKGTQESIEGMLEENTQKGVEIASLAAETMKEVHGSLSDSLMQVATEGAATVSGTVKVAEKVTEATTLAQQVSLGAVSAVVENGSEAQAKAAVQTHIDTVVKDAQTTQVLAAEVKKAVESHSAGMTSTTATALTLSLGVTSTALSVSTTVQALLSQSVERTTSIQDSSVITAPTTTVIEALEKAKSATAANIEAKSTLVDLTKNIVSGETAISTTTASGVGGVSSSTPVLTTTTTK